MKTYKARFKEMNAYYLDRIRKLQDQLHAEKIARQQIDRIYQGYLAQIIKKYGLKSGSVYLDTDFPVLDYEIRAEQSVDRRIRLRAVNVNDDDINENDDKEVDEEIKDLNKTE